MAETLFKALPLSQRHFKAGPCPNALFDRVESLIQSPDRSEQFLCAASGLELLYTAIAFHSKARRDAQGWGEERAFDEALRLIEERLGNASFDVSRLAEEIGVHRTTLSRVFMAKMRTPPLKYIKARRLQKAIELLKEGREPIKEVAARTGFASPEYFIRCVRSATGMTPGQLRKTYGHG
jgi:AraC-like DNA-binding protein